MDLADTPGEEEKHIGDEKEGAELFDTLGFAELVKRAAK